ncbi:MAG: carbohydrate-binding domain-containing protein, partial [Paludibacteraceae bacterium]|nr:carbohydrate-binding domain-containing protein [Paludibacteraceae bacterium]
MKRKNITLLISVLALTLSHCTTELPQLPDENDSDFVEDHTFNTVVAISYDNNTVIVTPETDDITSSIVGGNITIDSRKKYVEYILTGTTDNGSFKLYSTNKCKVTLNNVHITSNNTPAINIQTSKSIFVNIANDTENTLSDKNPYILTELEDAKGTFF